MNALLENLPSAEQAALAKASSRELAGFIESGLESQQLSIIDKDGFHHVVELPTSALRFLVTVLTELGEGNTVNLVPIHAELTTQEGADLLNMSRPSFIKLLDEGAIPYHRTGNRRKVKYVDIMEYKHRVDDARRATLDELSALDQELGLMDE